MKKLYQVQWLSLTALIFFHGHAFCSDESKPLPLKSLPRMVELGENQKAAYIDVLKSERGYGACKESVYDCLTGKKADPAAVRIANFGAYLVSKGVPPKNLGLLISERAAFAGREETGNFTYTETPSKGNPGAKIVITEFAEFKCPYCVTLSPVLEKLVKESKGQVRLFFKHFPLKNHPGTRLSSQAAQAAHRQGKFWEMYDRLFRDMNKQSMDDLLRYAAEIGLDVERFKRDLEDPTLVAIIERDKMEGVKANVRGTPTLFINGKMYHFRHDEAFLKDIINEEAERLGVMPPYDDWRYE